MKINDCVYGEFEITENILIELINCKTLQRLKNISQMGMPDEYYHKKGFSRFEHSVGVMLLLKKLGASLDEQIAGLLHDVSHTAFSHVIDWVLGDPTKEDYQDNSFLDFIEKSEIPKILEKYGFDYRSLCELERFSLLENAAPNICADRVDYLLREIVRFEEPKIFRFILDSLTSYKGTIVFNSIDAAEIFASNYARCQKEHWAGEEARTRYYLLAQILKQALGIKLINISDFWKTDYEVIDILQNSNDSKILDGLSLLKNGFKIIKSKSNNSIILHKKFRCVNPYVLNNNSIILLSNLSKNYKESLEKQKRESLEPLCVEVVTR
ncbi:MAG: HD domain-containing protein [Nanoarchaeota archaeon]